tara:strand:- start:429 stop:572 length:144 start_codon:yes stop_codon:yes gene_type:complete
MNGTQIKKLKVELNNYKTMSEKRAFVDGYLASLQHELEQQLKEGEKA